MIIIPLFMGSSGGLSARGQKCVDCELWMPEFNAQTASDEGKRKYAECVRLLHPEPWAITARAVLLRVWFLAIVLGIPAGGFIGWSIDGDYPMHVTACLIGVMVGGGGALFGGMALAGIYYGFKWFFTGKDDLPI